MKDFKENLQKCQSYIQALEEERRKIQVFQRELPLCLELVTQAIDACKQQLSGASNGTPIRECLNNRQISNNNNNNSECTSDKGPIFEEFIPLKRSQCSDDEEHKDEMSDDHHDNHDDHDDDVDHKSEEKSDWLRSVQLWNQTPDPPTSHLEHQPKRVQVVEVTNGAHKKIEEQEKSKGNCDVKRSNVEEAANSTCTTAKAVAAAGRPAGSSSAGGGSANKEEKGGQSQRKSRRCWSPELHKRFLHALQQLGGSHAATPKQIRELMKVDGLTNDEVKSHLQKYRLHTRRPTSTTNNNTINNQQSPQFVVVGGVWMPPTECTSMAPIGTNSRETSPTSVPNNIYTPIATMASPSPNSQRKQHKQASQSHEERGSHSHGGVHSNSTSTSSSTHTITASQLH